MRLQPFHEAFLHGCPQAIDVVRNDFHGDEDKRVWGLRFGVWSFLNTGILQNNETPEGMVLTVYRMNKNEKSRSSQNGS
jgi:hypothetical protein